MCCYIRGLEKSSTNPYNVSTKYFAKQRLKMQQTDCNNWWKTTSKFLELKKTQHTFNCVLNSFELLSDFVQNASEHFASFSNHLNPLPASDVIKINKDKIKIKIKQFLSNKIKIKIVKFFRDQDQDQG